MGREGGKISETWLSSRGVGQEAKGDEAGEMKKVGYSAEGAWGWGGGLLQAPIPQPAQTGPWFLRPFQGALAPVGPLAGCVPQALPLLLSRSW